MSQSIKNRLKTYSFWVSLASAVLLLIQSVGKPLGLVLNEELYMSIVNSVLGVFVVLEIISHPAQTLVENKDENDEEYIIESKEGKTEKTELLDTKSNCTNSESDVDVVKNDDVKTLEQIQSEILRQIKDS